MKLPIQAQPVMRNVSSVRISAALISGVTASECDMSTCGWAIAACAPAVFGGPTGVAGCLIGLGAGGCVDCVGGPTFGSGDPSCPCGRGRFGECLC